MRLLTAVIVLSLVAATASAETPLRTLSPATGTLHRIVPKQSPRPGPAPRAYTMQQRAFAVQKVLNLPVTPTLGQPITLTPSVPFIAGLAELEFSNATVWSGNITSAVPAGGQVQFNFSEAGYVRIVFNARAGQRYAIDCRTSTDVTHLNYDIAPGPMVGTVPIGQDGHVIIAMDKVPANGMVAVNLYPFAPAGWVFYGCDISPF
jgi:hypothetical protein